jgi:hypothetical protein
MVRIHEWTAKLPSGTAYCLATQYQVKGGFTSNGLGFRDGRT